jgi:creatinine amidohydrolase/Fe(II)-dependent formamide hydrolase-like protein
MQQWLQPDYMYVVDVHGSIVHRNAIVRGLGESRVSRWSFRWLYDPIVQFAGDRGDQHAGGVETALVERANHALVDRSWWPERIGEIKDRQMDMEFAIEMTPHLSWFIKEVESNSYNGIVGDVQNYYNVDADLMFERMLAITRGDLAKLTESNE